MPEIQVQDEQGNTHIFPDGSTPEMIAKAMNVKVGGAFQEMSPPGVPNPIKPQYMGNIPGNLPLVGNMRLPYENISYPKTATQPEIANKPQITPSSLAQGAAQDISNLSVLTPIQAEAAKLGLTGKLSGVPVLRHLTEPPPSPEALTSSALNFGTGVLTGAAEGGARPGLPAQPETRVSAEPPVPPTGLLTPEQEAANRTYTEQHPTGSSPYQPQNITPEFQADIDKYNRPAVLRQQAQAFQQDAKALHNKVYGGLVQQADAMRDATEGVTRSTLPIEEAIEKARTELSGTPADLAVFRQIMNAVGQPEREMGAQVFADATGRGVPMQAAAEEAGGAMPPAEVSFRDMQRQYTALSNQWADAAGNIKRVLGDVRSVYANELKQGAESVGKGVEWSQLQKGFSNYYRDWRGSGPLARVVKASDANYVTPVVTGKAGDLLRDTYARYGDPSAIDQLRQTANPPPVPPPPAPPKLGFIKGKVLPKIGGVITAKTNLPFPGHPIVNYEAGREITKAALERISRRTPPTPEAYTREIMGASPATQNELAAKYGVVTPATATAIAQRNRMNLKTRRIPQQP